MTNSGVVKRAALTAVSAFSLAILAGMGGGCAKEQPPFDPREIQRLERDNVNAAAVPPKRALPPEALEEAKREDPTPRPTGGGAGTVVRMPLREIIQRAVANNTDVKVAGYDPG